MSDDFLVPPQAPDIERAVLGAMLFETDAIDIAVEKLNTDAFYKPAHFIIFEAIKTLRNENCAVDQLTVVEELRKRGALDQVGGESAIASLSGEITSSANISYHCDILNEKAALRKFIAITTSARNQCYQDGTDPDEIAAQLYLQSVAVMDNRDIKPYRVLSDVVHESFAWIVKKSEQRGTMGIPTGIYILDKYTDGWQEQDLIIIKGDTGQGKSALATNRFACKAGECGIPTAVFNLEMSAVQMGVRLISGSARIDLSEVQYNQPTPEEWTGISNACGRLTNYPIYIDETPGLSIGQISAKVRRLQRDRDIRLVIVDYLQLMEGKSDSQNREREVASISRSLKLLAKSMKIPVIALSQVNEMGKSRESRAIEQDADKVILIEQPNEDDKIQLRNDLGCDNENIRVLFLQKNRGGKTGRVFVTWVPEHVNFYDLAY